MDFARDFLVVFIPLFVAIDPFGMVPIFLGVTDRLDERQRRRVTFEAVCAATAITIGFMLLGRATFAFLGISGDDFKIAGGLILLVYAILDLLGPPGKPAVDENYMVGIVPLAMPLIAGPALLTSVLVLHERYGWAPTVLGLAVNFLILLAVMLGATRISRRVGVNTIRAFSKIVMVLLAAIAVNYIRSGLAAVIATRGQ